MKYFSDDQIYYMKNLGISADFSNPSDDEWLNIEDVVSDRLLTHGFDSQYNPNDEGLICESIIDITSKQ